MTSQPRREAALVQAIQRNILPETCDTIQDKPFALFYDMDEWNANLAGLRAAFPSHWLHCAAVKTNPLASMLAKLQALGHGAECASVSEVLHSLNAGFDGSRVVFDSPCKTIPEIRFALEKGVHLNIDNLQELDRVEAVMKSLGSTTSTVGIRINPLVGAGTIAAFSVSTGKSKFGIPLYEDEAFRQELCDRIVNDCPFVTCVHVHTGSGGMGLKQMVQGARTAVDLALRVNKAANKQQIRVIDIGGGLATNFADDQVTPTFKEYSDALREVVPELFDGSVFSQVVTEFGAACHIKFGWLASRVEYVKETREGDHTIALIHAGSDMFMRSCYCPNTFMSHRVRLFGKDGQVKLAETTATTNSDGKKKKTLDVAGPLCFAGDVIVRDVDISGLESGLQVGDVIMLLDAGGNTMSIHTTHCSRTMPPVFGYSGDTDKLEFEVLKEAQTIESAIGLFC